MATGANDHGEHHSAAARRSHSPHPAKREEVADQQAGGASESRLAVMATTHCLLGCAIGEVLGLAIGTALGWGNAGTMVLAIVLAFIFGYGLTSVPLLRAGMGVREAVPVALASDTASIATMEVIDNAFIAVVPGAMDAGLGDVLFWASIAAGFAVAFPVAFLVNRHLIRRGRGHALVHERHRVPAHVSPGEPAAPGRRSDSVIPGRRGAGSR